MEDDTMTKRRDVTSGSARARGVDRGKRATALPKDGRGTVAAQYVRCGKSGCRCLRDALHGPYFYLFWREGGRLRKRYLRAEEVDAARAACAARRARDARRRAALAASRELWRSLTARLKEVTGDA